VPEVSMVVHSQVGICVYINILIKALFHRLPIRPFLTFFKSRIHE
jgi:hypothetical protein